MSHVTLDKNFRLTASARPSRYDFSLRLFPDQRQFTGEGTLHLTLDEPQESLILHGIGLDVTVAKLHAADGHHTASDVVAHAESETFTFRFQHPLPAGQVQLQVQWQGRFNDGLRGLYLGGDVAVTQFEAADARRVFPCFDEPAFKASWKLKLDVPVSHTALSNGVITGEKHSGERKVVEFAETEVLSSYLIALVSGPLVGSDTVEAGGTPIRTWAIPAKSSLTSFGQEVAQAVLPKLQDYFGLPYAFAKVDQVGIPNFEAGAMENAGLVTYRETALLLDPSTASLPVKKRVAEVITHELAHQWFGNWVTMVWWDDLWLNEAFATWMAYKVVDQWKPEWRIWVDFEGGKSSALFLDSLQSTHPIRADVANAHQATENFDLITYEKGGSVLRMIENYLGEERFREGIRVYMKRFARGNAVADDLWMALEESSQQPVVELANAWIRQPGYPVVSAQLAGRVLSLSQSRFSSSGSSKDDSVWPVPVVLRLEDASGVHEQRVLLRERDATVTLEGQGEVKWLCANARSTGFYRVDYDAGLRTKLVSQLSSLDVTERMGLLADGWALFRAGKMEIASVLDIIERLGSDTDDAVLDDVVGRLSAIDYRLVGESELPAFRAFVGKLLRPQWTQVGWEPKAGESDGQRLRRAALLRGMGLVAREKDVATAAAQKFAHVLGGNKQALEANLHDAAAAMSARNGDASLFEQVLSAYRAETDPAFKRRYLSALAAFEQSSAAPKSRALLLSDDVTLQDFSGYLSTLMANPVSRQDVWSTMKSQFGSILERSKSAPMIQRRVVESLGSLREAAELADVRVLFERNPLPEQKQGVAQTLERLEQDVALRARAMPGVKQWLAGR